MSESTNIPDPHSRRTERLVGLFVMAAVLLLLVGFGFYLQNLAERKGWRVPHVPYYTRLASAEGLNVGDPVTMVGFTVGQITTIEMEPPEADKKVFIGIQVRKPYYGYIWTDSKVRIVTSGLLGGRRIEITPGAVGSATVFEEQGQIDGVFVDGQRVKLTKEPKGVMLVPDEAASLSDRAEKLLDEVELALPNILAVTNRLNGVLDNAAVFLTNSTALVVNLNQSTAQLPSVISNANVITANLRDPHGSFGEWLIPDDMHTNLEVTLQGLNDTLINLANITSNLNGQVQGNDQILTGVSKMVTDTDDLVQGLKKHWLLRGAFAKSKVETNKPAQLPEKK